MKVDDKGKVFMNLCSELVSKFHSTTYHSLGLRARGDVGGKVEASTSWFLKGCLTCVPFFELLCFLGLSHRLIRDGKKLWQGLLIRSLRNLI